MLKQAGYPPNEARADWPAPGGVPTCAGGWRHPGPDLPSLRMARAGAAGTVTPGPFS
jgi:hypothetical protein